MSDSDQDRLDTSQMHCVVTDFERDRRIALAPSPYPSDSLRDAVGDLSPTGHTWSWELEPTASGGTRLTLTYDWSGVRDERTLAVLPRVSEEQMAATIARLAEATR